MAHAPAFTAICCVMVMRFSLMRLTGMVKSHRYGSDRYGKKGKKCDEGDELHFTLYESVIQEVPIVYEISG